MTIVCTFGWFCTSQSFLWCVIKEVSYFRRMLSSGNSIALFRDTYAKNASCLERCSKSGAWFRLECIHKAFQHRGAAHFKYYVLSPMKL